ncbi:uncharacterized protein LOC129778295 [Toxorhynchites rutilus septentrionalis]|uniref:uncharacterized protein LOC129778295 n=1 Tax=Toxorhynchites rutilus septentrionalis TaxID=329112 RepID=UPI002478C808|nr:uncharacterized protein LOC129778295 [Toxorhynchites rutilus septentrionalis]
MKSVLRLFVVISPTALPRDRILQKYSSENTTQESTERQNSFTIFTPQEAEYSWDSEICLRGDSLDYVVQYNCLCAIWDSEDMGEKICRESAAFWYCRLFGNTEVKFTEFLAVFSIPTSSSKTRSHIYCNHDGRQYLGAVLGIVARVQRRNYYDESNDSYESRIIKSSKLKRK